MKETNQYEWETLDLSNHQSVSMYLLKLDIDIKKVEDEIKAIKKAATIKEISEIVMCCMLPPLIIIYLYQLFKGKEDKTVEPRKELEKLTNERSRLINATLDI